MVNLAVYSVFSLAGAFSPNAAVLVETRFLAGIGIGAEFALLVVDVAVLGQRSTGRSADAI